MAQDPLLQPPPHLIEAQKSAAPKADDQPKTAPDEQASSGVDPRKRRDYNFRLDWTDPTGKRWVGSFTSTIPTIGQEQKIGLMAAERRKGIAPAMLDAGVQEIILNIVNLDVMLTKREPWAEDLDELPYLQLLSALAKEAFAHYATFHGSLNTA